MPQDDLLASSCVPQTLFIQSHVERPGLMVNVTGVPVASLHLVTPAGAIVSNAVVVDAPGAARLTPSVSLSDRRGRTHVGFPTPSCTHEAAPAARTPLLLT